MKIENYRPITLLETDYKIHTKPVANKLGRVCQNLIHKDQAGFVLGRSLFDYTRLAHLVVDYAEKQEQNGCIISLNQEKAYDKIDHKYLWYILEEYIFPREFIKLIKTMYSKSKTSVMINRVTPAPIKVERGVLQGDPMSCLLYNLAIEPLVTALRASTKLKGINIMNHTKLITKLFADDTLVYLGKNDKFKDLEDIINLLCRASTA